MNTLKRIEGNTANLITLVNLIQTSNDKQDEVLEIITDLFALAKEIEEEEVKTNYRKVMDKINSFTGDIETMMTLSTFGMMIYQAVTVGA